MRTANNQENLCERKRERGGEGGERVRGREWENVMEPRESVMKRKEERNKKESRDALINTDDT